ncbi:MAG: shikimate dehydrogenase [Nitrospirota bacterium]
MTQTKLVGIFGDPVSHSRSPAMQNAAFRAAGLDYVYVPFAVARGTLPHAVGAIRALGLAGVNVTIPHKERVISYLDEVTAEARLVGAVNTIVNRRGRLVGHNTDGRGLLLALQKTLGASARGRSVCLLGAGGAARGVAAALLQAGAARVLIANRTRRRAAALAKHLRTRFRRSPAALRAIALSPASLARETVGCDWLINATAVGLKPTDPRLIRPALLRRFSLVCDLIYNPPQTRLLKDARRAGCRTMNGLEMLVYQGALAFELWTGRRAPVRVMRRAALGPKSRS